MRRFIAPVVQWLCEMFGCRVSLLMCAVPLVPCQFVGVCSAVSIHWCAQCRWCSVSTLVCAVSVLSNPPVTAEVVKACSLCVCVCVCVCAAARAANTWYLPQARHMYSGRRTPLYVLLFCCLYIN